MLQIAFGKELKVVYWQEICTPERRDAAEGEDRRSVSLEMIRRALILPPEDELKDTLITKTKSKHFCLSNSEIFDNQPVLFFFTFYFFLYSKWYFENKYL